MRSRPGFLYEHGCNLGGRVAESPGVRVHNVAHYEEKGACPPYHSCWLRHVREHFGPQDRRCQVGEIETVSRGGGLSEFRLGLSTLVEVHFVWQ